MYENIDGIAQKLAVPLKIVHPAPFIAEMNGQLTLNETENRLSVK
jgi:hypothetical protein